MFGRSPSILIILLLVAGVFMLTAVPVMADEVYAINKDFQVSNSSIVVHVIGVNVSDKFLGNIYPSKAPEDTKWAHLVYQYENTGNTLAVGYIWYSLTDANGAVYNLSDKEYTGVEVQPHTRSDIRWNEVPVPITANITKVTIYSGTNPQYRLWQVSYDVHLTQSSTGTVTPTGAPTSAPPGASGTNPYGCWFSPLLPFVILSSLALVGVYIKGRGIKK